MPTKKTKRRRKGSPNRLQSLRLDRKLSLEDVAMDTGAFRSAVHRWENGLAEPSSDYRTKYAACLGITPAQLGAIVYGG